jgi:hypothetical protein
MRHRSGIAIATRIVLFVASISAARAESVSHVGCHWCTEIGHLDNAVISYLAGSHTLNGQPLSHGPATPIGTRIFVVSSAVRISAQYVYHGMEQQCFEHLRCVWYPLVTNLTTSSEAAIQLDRELLGRMKEIPPFEIPPGSWAGVPGASISIQQIVGEALGEAQWQICLQHPGHISCVKTYSRC